MQVKSYEWLGDGGDRGGDGVSGRRDEEEEEEEEGGKRKARERTDWTGSDEARALEAALAAAVAALVSAAAATIAEKAGVSVQVQVVTLEVVVEGRFRSRQSLPAGRSRSLADASRGGVTMTDSTSRRHRYGPRHHHHPRHRSRLHHRKDRWRVTGGSWETARLPVRRLRPDARILGSKMTRVVYMDERRPPPIEEVWTEPTETRRCSPTEFLLNSEV